MTVKPLDLGNGTEIGWTIPQEISNRTDIDQIKVFRSNSPDSNYALLTTLATTSADLKMDYQDTEEFSSRTLFYLVTFISTTGAFESCFHTTFFRPLPSESMLIEKVRRTLPEILRPSLTDEDILNGLNVAVQIFNTYPPETNFSLHSFPKSHEYFVTALASMTALASRYLTLSIRDFRYSEPGGVVMDIDRGAKINSAIEIISKVFTQYMPIVKLDFSADFPMGLGTIQLPLSMGGIVSRGLLNILDIFTAVGR